jgi:hypothetical protein
MDTTLTMMIDEEEQWTKDKFKYLTMMMFDGEGDYRYYTNIFIILLLTNTHKWKNKEKRFFAVEEISTYVFRSACLASPIILINYISTMKRQLACMIFRKIIEHFPSELSTFSLNPFSKFS